MLETIDGTLESNSPVREALKKAGLALSLCYMHGLRPDIDRHFQQLGTALSESERERLRSVGIDPESDKHSRE
jgi:hypothetical protein